MRIPFLFILLFISTTIFSQKLKPTFGFSILPNYSIQLYKEDGTTPESAKFTIKSLETWKFSYSVTAFSDIPLSESSNIVLGLGYYNNGSKTGKIKLNSTGSDPAVPESENDIYNHHFFEFSTNYKYSLTPKTYLTSGLSMIYNFSNTVTAKLYYSDGSKDRVVSDANTSLTNFRKINLLINLGIGTDIIVTEKAKWFTQLYFQYTTMAHQIDTPINRKFVTTGVALGVRGLSF